MILLSICAIFAKGKKTNVLIMELNRKKTVLMAIAIPMSLAVNAQNNLSTDTLADQTLEELSLIHI